jgi:hypothetical protein
VLEQSFIYTFVFETVLLHLCVALLDIDVFDDKFLHFLGQLLRRVLCLLLPLVLAAFALAFFGPAILWNLLLILKWRLYLLKRPDVRLRHVDLWMCAKIIPLLIVHMVVGRKRRMAWTHLRVHYRVWVAQQWWAWVAAPVHSHVHLRVVRVRVKVVSHAYISPRVIVYALRIPAVGSLRAVIHRSFIHNYNQLGLYEA